MTTMQWFILDGTQAIAAVALNPTEDGAPNVFPIAVTSASPGVGLNLNDLCEDFDPGEAVPLTGKKLLPNRIINDPEWQPYPNMIAYLLTLPTAQLENETIFLPVSEEV